MNTININLKTIKNSISVGRQFDHNITKLHFEGLEPNVSYQLLIDLEPYGTSKPTLISLVNNEWLISNTYTQNSGVFPCQLLAFVNNEWKQYSQIFSLILDNSLGNGVPKEDIPPRFETKFNEMVNLINQVQTKLNNGEFNGESAYELAIKNGYKGTEQEWLESLKYQHSVEFDELAKQVRLNAQQVNNDKLQVNTDKAQVNNDKTQVSADKTQVAQDKQQVEAKALEVNNKALQVSQDKVHIDNVVKEFDAKVTQANVVIDDKVKQASDSANLSKQSADSVSASASQIDKNKNDILKLAIKPSVSGNPCVINDSSEYDLLGLEVYGQSEQNGVPTPDAPVEIVNKVVEKVEVTGKNLLQGKMYLVNYSHGKGHIPDLQYIPTLPYTPSFETTGIGYVIPCEKGQTYTMSVTNPNPNAVVGITEYAKMSDTNNVVNVIGYANTTPINCTYTAQTNGILVCFIAGYWTNGNTTIHTCTDTELLQVEYGNVVTPYQPYKSQQITLTQPITLRGLKSEQGNVDINGVKYISDVICERNGVYGVERNTGNIVVDGVENKFSTNGDDVFWNLPWGSSPKIIETPQANYSNYFEHNYFSANANGEFAWVYKTNGQKYFTDINKLNEFVVQKNTEGKPLEIYYAVKPTFEPLPQQDQDAIKKLKSYYPNTIINTNAFTQTNYVADTKNYIDNSIAEYHAQAQAQQVAMMSLLPDDTQATMIEKDQQNLLGGI